ncbi:DUF4347 domain-containing protein [Tumidithrix elongata RA019]|uniref:DUF4347 domain-containing protein n=1 Tax=Tumidithrix elongata BACA0141 TaxID=2716417 RepID=A0AAW9PSN1_9CYAN|nr:DUF4347 domain-containing protein [Tumidithrix elongata RA019]
MKSATKMYKNTVAAIAISLFTTLIVPSTVSAQTIIPSQDGTGTVVLPNGQRFDITGGTQAGANLFHSFQQFGLNQGQIANFLSQPNIQNILSRVVGGDPSVINGLIQLTGGNSNLYIMNPAGIIFGANASLNVPASFTATTASGIQIGNGWFGINTRPSDLKNLTGMPNAFAFNTVTPLPNQTQTGVVLNQGNLSVPQGQSITLVGGIAINTGTISTPNGKINIAAIPDGKYVRITPEGGLLSLDLPIAMQQELGATKPINAVDLPKLLTGLGITAPTTAGEAIASGQLTAANIDILANRYDTSKASLNATNIQQGWNLVFVDSTIKNYQTLIDGTKGGSSVTVINPDQNGIRKITTTLANITGANSLHIISEGDAGNFWLGKDFVSNENIGRYSSDLQSWRTALSPAASILLYACNLANGEKGTALVQAVKTLTGHDVAASTNRTGSAALGGDWNLEYQTGKNSTAVIFNNVATQAYQNTLAIFTVTDASDASANSLRAQIAAANAAVGADTIRFDTTGIFATPQIITLTTGELLISEDLTIQGTGASNLTISGNNASRVFNITAGNVTFDSLKIANGNSGVGNNGGGILNTGGNLTLTNSIVSGNTAGNRGGGVSTTGAVTLANSTVLSNTAGNDGGGIWSFSTVTLIDSAVSGNTATVGGGGIVGFGVVTLTNSTVSNNTAIGGSGGGIFGNVSVTLSNSIISGNIAGANWGGGIYGTGDVTLTNSTVSGNLANIDGGGIYGAGTIVSLTNSTISGNTARNNGGGIYGSGAAVNLTNSTVSGNLANVDGGGIASTTGGTIANSTITNNTADFDNNGTGNGGGLFREGGTFTISNSIVAGNVDRGLQAPDIGSNALGVGFTNGGNNLIGANNGFAVTFPVSALVGTIANPVDPKLAPLGNYGGATQTHALLPGSPALDAGNNAGVPATDQRGAIRILGGTVDIGAFESQGFSLTPLASTTPQSANINTNFATLLGVQVTENFVNSPVFAPGILVTFTPSSNAASGTFAGNASVLTNQFGIAIAPVFTANGVAGSYTVAATANGFKPVAFSLTNQDLIVGKSNAGGFGGVYPSREDIHGRPPELDEQALEDPRKILCLDPALVTPKTTSIPTCKKP